MVDLHETLALIADRLNKDARVAFLDLLAGESKPQVESLVRQIDSQSGPLSEYQRQLLAGLSPPLQRESATVDAQKIGGDIDDGGVDSETADPGSAESEVGLSQQMQIPSDSSSNTEHAATVAVLAMLCAAGDKYIAGDLLVHLPLHIQGPLVCKVLKTSPLNATSGLSSEHCDVVEAIREAIPAREAWGIDAVCAMLRSLDSNRHLRRLLTAADEIDHESVVILQNNLFNFEDLLRLSSRDQQALLVQVDNEMLGQALLSTEERVRKGLLGNVSNRRRTTIDEEEDRWSESTQQEIEIAQRVILSLARTLYEDGKISTYFGSVNRKGLNDFEYDEATEKEDEKENNEEVEEKPVNRLRYLFAGSVLVFGSAAIWWLVSVISLGGGQELVSSGRAFGGSGGLIATANSGIGGSAEEQYDSASQTSSRQKLPAEAVLEVIGFARTEALQPSEIDPVDEGDDVLRMRVGNMRTMVLDVDFTMHTPVVQIKGLVRGAIFNTRVALDAGTTVEVEQGIVEVHSLLREDGRWRLERGSSGYFDTAGNGRITRNKNEGS